MKILITGADGYVGRELVNYVVSRGLDVTKATRFTKFFPDGSLSIGVGAIDKYTKWENALNGCDRVVHLAARAHIMNERSPSPLSLYRSVNVDGTLSLARQAARSGICRFVFVSSIGVNGKQTFDNPYFADGPTLPHSPYAISKLEAEQGLREIEAETGMEIVIIRPPLVYGPNAPGNFGSLLRWVARGAPLPFGAIHNKRSFVGLDNLTDLLFNCLTHPAAAGQNFLVSDGEDVSTSQLLRRTAQAMGKQAVLLPVPVGLLHWSAALAGKRDMAQRLCGSLQVDIGKTRHLLSWAPPLTLDQGLKKAVEGLKL